MLPRWRKSLRPETGVAVIEFALVLVVLLLLTVGITELGRAFWYYDALQKAVREGARCESLIVPANVGTAPDTSCVNRVVADANAAGINPLLDPDQVLYAFDYATGSTTQVEYVSITLSNYQMPWIWSLGAPLPGPGDKSGMSVHATMPYMK